MRQWLGWPKCDTRFGSWVRRPATCPRFHLGAPHLQYVGVRHPRRVPVLVVPVAMGTGVSGQAAAVSVPARAAAYGENFEYGPPSADDRPSGSPGSAPGNAAAAAHARSGSRCGRRPFRAADRRRRQRASSPAFGHAQGTASLSRRLPSHCTIEKASLASRRPKVHGDCVERRGGDRRRVWSEGLLAGVRCSDSTAARACSSASSVRLTCDGEWYGSRPHRLRPIVNVPDDGRERGGVRAVRAGRSLLWAGSSVPVVDVPQQHDHEGGVQRAEAVGVAVAAARICSLYCSRWPSAEYPSPGVMLGRETLA